MHFGRRAFGVGNDDKRVDFEIRELAVDVDSVQSCYKIDEDVVDTFGHFFKQYGRNLIVRWVL